MFFCQKTDERTAYQKLENTNIGWLSAKDFLRKLWTTGSIEHTVMIDFKMCCLHVVLVLPGRVETQLGWSGKFLLIFL